MGGQCPAAPAQCREAPRLASGGKRQPARQPACQPPVCALAELQPQGSQPNVRATNEKLNFIKENTSVQRTLPKAREASRTGKARWQNHLSDTGLSSRCARNLHKPSRKMAPFENGGRFVKGHAFGGDPEMAKNRTLTLSASKERSVTPAGSSTAQAGL